MYEEFLNQNINCARQVADDAFLVKYASKAPKELITLWQEVGLGIFSNGLFRIVSPDDYQDFVDTYIEDKEKYFEYLLPFMTTAFGDIFVWVKDIFQNREYVIFINVRSGDWDIVTSRMDLLFSLYIASEGCLKRNFELKVSDFHKLVERLGLPAKDECYGYVPALALGGSKSLDNIQVVKMLPYIDMIAQMIGAFDMK